MKKILVTVAIPALIVVGCGDFLSKGDFQKKSTEAATDSTISAVSSASLKIKVNSGRIYSDSVQVNFWYLYDNGVTWAKVIDDKGKVVSIDTLNGSKFNFPSGKNNTYSINGLTPSTHYTLIIDGIYKGSDPWTLPEISFTTRARSTVIDTVTKNTVVIKNVEPFADSVKFVFTYKYNKGSTIANIIDPAGKVVLSDTLSKLDYNFPVNTDNSHVIKKLLPETRYGLLIKGSYDNGVKLLPWSNDTVFFTTLKASVEPKYTIDAISSASNKIGVKSGTIGSNSVSINFWYKYSNGFTWAKIIDDQGAEVLFDTISNEYVTPAIVGPTPMTNSDRVLEPLLPNTHYRLIIDGNWNDGSTTGNPNVKDPKNWNNDMNWSFDTIPFTTRK